MDGSPRRVSTALRDAALQLRPGRLKVQSPRQVSRGNRARGPRPHPHPAQASRRVPLPAAASLFHFHSGRRLRLARSEAATGRGRPLAPAEQGQAGAEGQQGQRRRLGDHRDEVDAFDVGEAFEAAVGGVVPVFQREQEEIVAVVGEPDEPIADHTRSILDGHIMLSRDLAARNHYPCIDVGHSVSRLFTNINSDEHKKAAAKLREVQAKYIEAEDLINIGAYQKGSNPGIDHAVEKIDAVNGFLKQGVFEKHDFNDTVKALTGIF